MSHLFRQLNDSVGGFFCFGKTDQFVSFSEKYSSLFCHTFAAVKLT